MLFCAGTAFSEPVTWNIMTNGAWEENKTLHNRLDLRLLFPVPNLTLRGQVLDRRPLNFELDSPWGEKEKWITHYQGALYHNTTGSRLLYGALDEWGLSARIRNPWIRSPPFAENHKPLIADLKTAASSTKEDEVYLYLSTPFITVSPNFRTRGFVSAQTEVGIIESEYKQTAVSAGLDLALPGNTSLLFETIYTWAVLPPTVSSTWFSDSPPLPKRDFNLYAAGILFSNSFLAISSDAALSETFAWSPLDFYANLGISVSIPVRDLPVWNTGRIERPLTISLAADGAGKRFVYRDGGSHGAGFRSAAKIELKGARNALLRFSTTLRAHEFPGRDFRRSSTNLYYRLPTAGKDSPFLRLTRLSLTADRNADNHLKITDRFHGYAGFSLNFSGLKAPIGVVFNGSIRGITAEEGAITPYPIPSKPWNFEDLALYGEFSFSPSILAQNYQFKTRIGYSNDSKKREIWDFSASAAVRFAKGRLSFKLTSPKLPKMWYSNISWRLEVKSREKDTISR